jgi:2-desacetyl-2-hydroxyethyl bacteriochlorophyllide A dehydrogenase
MQSIVLQEPGRFVLHELAAIAPPAPHEATIRIHRIGICGTDIHAYRGRQPFFTYPRRLGHELGAEVVAIGNQVNNLALGSRVAVEPYLTCGHCQACSVGKTNCCENLLCLGVHTDGGMVEYLNMPAAKLHKSEVLSYEQLALVETLGIGCHAVNRADIDKNDTVMVIGAGPIGLSVLQFACQQAVPILLADSNPNRLKFANEIFEIKHNILADGPITEEAVRAQLGGKLPTVVIDATGNKHSMEGAFGLVAHGGKLVYVGLIQGDISFADPHLHRREISLLASRNSVAADFKLIISQMESGQINTTPWITHRASFTSLPKVFENWLLPESRVIKAMLELR